MNNARRKQIRCVADTLSNALSLLEDIKSEEEDSLNNIPENMQSSERYRISENAVDALDEAVSSIEEALSSLDSSIE